MTYLIASVVALGLGPLLYRFAGASRPARTLLDVLVIVAVAWLVFVLLPHSFRETGWVGVAPLLLGVLGPTLVERWLRRLASRAHTAVRVVVVVGMSSHAFLDGVGLALPAALGDESAALPLAITLHRLAEGLVAWWLVRPSYGVRAAALALGVLALATAAGFAAGDSLGHHLPAYVLALFLAFASGSLLHVVVHSFETL